MTTRQVPICPTFNLPYFIMSYGRIYLSGHSYFRLNEAVAGTAVPLSILYASREESDAVIQLRLAISNLNFMYIKDILDLHPALPRLLTNTRGRCDQEANEQLFGLLLVMGRVRDLERLYGVIISDGTSEDGTPPQDVPAVLDSDEQPRYEMITQRESFGSRAALVHERICVRRSSATTLISCWAPDAISTLTPVKLYPRWPTRGLVIERMLGKGSYGYVFEVPRQAGLFKFSTTTSEYVRELLTQCVLSTLHTGLPQVVETPTMADMEAVQHHLLELTPLHPVTRQTAAAYAETVTAGTTGIHADLQGVSLSVVDQLSLMVKLLMNGVRALRDRFIMHLDISTTNVMWDNKTSTIRIIDYGGTIGDDSFLDIGRIVTRVCTRSTRAPEYGSGETIWQRNESSEALSAYYSIMSHIFDQTVLGEQPYAKEKACSAVIKKELDKWDAEWRTSTGDKELPRQLEFLRRVHLASRSLPKDRPPIDWILST